MIIIGKIVNVSVAATNIFGIAAYSHAEDNFTRGFVLAMMIASTLMHLSDQKHWLPGIYPFNRYSKLFLILDRTMASIAATYYLYACCTGMPVRWGMIVMGFIAMIMAEILEPIMTPLERWMWFSFWHTLWHLFAYSLLVHAVQWQKITETMRILDAHDAAGEYWY